MSESMKREWAKLRVASRKDKDGSEYFEGTLTFPVIPLCPAKVQKSDGTTKFSTRSALMQAAKNAANKLSLELVDESPVKQAAKKSPVKQAAKKKTPKVTSPTWLKS